MTASSAGGSSTKGSASPGVSAVIERLAARVIGQNPYDHERIYTELYCFTRPAAGGVVVEGLGAIENALLNTKAKALGVPCHILLGGKVRDRRARGPNPTRKPSVRTRQKCSGACCTTGGSKPLATPAVIFPPGC